MVFLPMEPLLVDSELWLNPNHTNQPVGDNRDDDLWIQNFDRSVEEPGRLSCSVHQ